MKHLLNNLSEEEKKTIREQHVGGMKVEIKNFKKLVETKQGEVQPFVNKELISKKEIKEQTSDMMSFEKVVEVPNTNKNDLFNLLKGNREIMRNGTIRSEIPGQQIDVEKNVLFDKSMYKLISKNPFSNCYYGKLKFDVLIVVKDNKYKIVCDNFVWSNNGSGCSVPSVLNPVTKSRPKGMTIAAYWDNISEILPKYVDSFYNNIKLTDTTTDF